MGRGNVRVNGPYEGLYYIDYDYIAVYKKTDAEDWEPDRKLRYAFEDESPEENGWEYDEGESVDEEAYVQERICAEFAERAPDFSPTNIWVTRTRRAILESPLFYIAVEDNGWSFAIELLQKDVETDEEEDAQEELYMKYLRDLERILLNWFPSVGIYAGPWTSGRITKEEFENG